MLKKLFSVNIQPTVLSIICPNPLDSLSTLLSTYGNIRQICLHKKGFTILCEAHYSRAW